MPSTLDKKEIYLYILSVQIYPVLISDRIYTGFILFGLRLLLWVVFKFLPVSIGKVSCYISLYVFYVDTFCYLFPINLFHVMLHYVYISILNFCPRIKSLFMMNSVLDFLILAVLCIGKLFYGVFDCGVKLMIVIWRCGRS